MADDLIAPQRASAVSPAHGPGRPIALDGIVESSQLPHSVGQQRIAGDLGVDVNGTAGQVAKDLPAVVVHPERLWDAVQARPVQVIEKRMDSRCPMPGRSSHRIADANCSSYVAAGERHFP